MFGLKNGAVYKMANVIRAEVVSLRRDAVASAGGNYAAPTVVKHLFFLLDDQIATSA